MFSIEFSVPEHLDLDDQRGALPIIDCTRIASLLLKRRREAGGSVPARGTCSVDFLDLRHFKFAAPAIHGVQPVERHCHSQRKEQTIAAGGPAKLRAGPIPTSRMT